MGHKTESWLRDLRRRLNGALLGVPVFVKVMGIALGMAVVLGSGMLWQIHQTWHAHMLRDLEQRGQKLAAQLGNHCLEFLHAGHAGKVQEELQHAVLESPDLVYAEFQDTNGLVLAQARASEWADAAPQMRELTTLLGNGTHQVRLGLSTVHVDREVGWLTWRLARTTAVIALLGMAAAWWLTRLFAHPIEELALLTREVKGGDYEVQAPVRAGDEVGELAAAFNQMTQALAQKEAGRQRLLHRVIRAGEEERKRLARELHDDTGQALTSQIAALSALEEQSRDATTRRRLADLRQQTEQTLEEVHSLAVTLRPSVLDDVGLRAALDRHCRMFAQRFGVQVACVDLDLGDRRLPAEVELMIYRVVQEALTNAVRHGHADRIKVLVQLAGAGVLTIVRDNGCGFDAHDWQKRCLEGNHLGLLGIEERVNLVGGSFCVDSQPGKGAAVYADVPLPQPG